MKITKAEYDALPEALKALYKVSGDGYESTFKTAEEHELEIRGLKDNNAALLLEKKQAKEQAENEARERQRIADEAAAKTGNVEALRTSYEAKLKALGEKSESTISGLKKTVSDLTVGTTAKDLSAKLFGKNAGIAGHIVASRLALEEQDGKHVVRVLGTDGKPSAATLEDLEKEIRGNKDYASVLVEPPSGGMNPDKLHQSEQKASFSGSNSLLDAARKIEQGLAE